MRLNLRDSVVQVGLVSSWSAYHTYLEQHPQQDPIPAFKQGLLAALGAQVTATTLRIATTTHQHSLPGLCAPEAAQ
jgi:hypothetical protein